MKNITLIFICFALIVSIAADTEIPCVACSADFNPVCAVPTPDNVKGGLQETFQNPCGVQAADCGFTKQRKS